MQQHRHSLWGTLDYQYDPLDRLTEERGVQGGRAHAYDAVGNRTNAATTPPQAAPPAARTTSTRPTATD
ncbi:hypothetical protein P4133_34645 [Pseudomonas aeruginosa]|nr:hypothetical protein [Pseudomonas aeruginosa]